MTILIFFGILINLFQATPVYASDPPLLDATSVATSSGSGTLTWSHTVTSADNRLLLVSFFNRNVSVRALANSVTYNGISLTRITTTAPLSNSYEELWYLVNPNSGTHNISISVSANGGSQIYNAVASSWTNVDQNTPIGTFGSNSVGSGSAQTLSLSNTTTKDIVVDGVITNNGATISHAGTTVTVVTSIGSSFNAYANSTPGVAGTTTIGFTPSKYSDNNIVAVVVHPFSNTYAISGNVFNDFNSNGVKDVGEIGFENVT
ncbi:MAG: hypothetical protein WCP17_03695, partial [bacterium]